MASVRWVLVFPLLGFAGGVFLVASAVSPRAPGAPAASGSVAMYAVSPSDAGGGAAPTAGFQIDARQVSVGDYDRCVRAGACTMFASASGPDDPDTWRHGLSSGCLGGRPDSASSAMNCVNATQAEAYCRWAGKRLPTQDEWLDGMRGADDDPAAARRRDALAGSGDQGYPGFASEEWTATAEGPGLTGVQATLRRACVSRLSGGGRTSLQTACRWRDVVTRKPFLGFRCAR